MKWMDSLEKVIEYIEDHLVDKEISIDEIGRHVGISTFYLQRSFQIATGYSIGDYIRKRRLYLAALDLKNTDSKVIDIAYKYGYETPESFTKAFTRFHDNTPSKVKEGGTFNPFYKITIQINIVQEEEMDFKVTPMFPIQLIGFEKEFNFENSYIEIPKFWDEICEKHCKRIYAGQDPETKEEHAIVDNCIGEYALCMDGDGKTFKYMLAGRYAGGEVPDGMKLVKLEKGDWAIFDCYGPNPKTLQEMNTKIFNDWIPNNKEYEVRGNYSIEWYDTTTNMSNPKYHSAIWIPIKNK